jgi:hypothetical protein
VTEFMRLSKDGEWAICASVPCGTQLARRIRRPVPSGATGHNEAVPIWPEPTTEAMLIFLSGWTQREGVWRMSPRAWRRMSQGRPPAFRRRPPGGTGPSRHSPRSNDAPDAWGGRPVDQYPATVVCPACGLQQIADADVLALS